MNRDERLAVLRADAGGWSLSSGPPTDLALVDQALVDPVLAACKRLVAALGGWYYNPAITPETVLRMVELARVDIPPEPEVAVLQAKILELRVQLAVHHVHLTFARGASCGECGSRDFTLSPELQANVAALISTRDARRAATVGVVLEGEVL